MKIPEIKTFKHPEGKGEWKVIETNPSRVGERKLRGVGSSPLLKIKGRQK
jgi:hypothetical protein